MITPRVPSPRLMVAAAAVLTPCVFVVPALLVASRGYAGEHALVASAESAFRSAELAGPVADSRGLAELTTVWREFHLVKAVLAGLLVLALLALASAVRRRAQASGRGHQRRVLVTAYAGVVVWLLGALTVLLANVQGAAAPLASVASLLPTGQRTGELGAVLGDLLRAVQGGSPSPAESVARELLGDFTLYHAVFAVLAAATGVVLTTVALRTVWLRWRSRGRSGGPQRSAQPTWLVQATLGGTAGALFLLLAVANASTWVHPAPALVASLGGG